MRATVTDLKRRTRAVLEALQRGETVTLTHGGSVCGYMVPPEYGGRLNIPIADDPAFGMWRDREDTRDAQAYVRKLRRPRSGTGRGERSED